MLVVHDYYGYQGSQEDNCLITNLLKMPLGYNTHFCAKRSLKFSQAPQATSHGNFRWRTFIEIISTSRLNVEVYYTLKRVINSKFPHQMEAIKLKTHEMVSVQPCYQHLTVEKVVSLRQFFVQWQCLTIRTKFVSFSVSAANPIKRLA